MPAGLLSRDREAEGVRGGEWTAEAGGDGRGEGAAEPAGMTGLLVERAEPEGTCSYHVSKTSSERRQDLYPGYGL